MINRFTHLSGRRGGRRSRPFSSAYGPSPLDSAPSITGRLHNIAPCRDIKVADIVLMYSTTTTTANIHLNSSAGQK